MIVTKKLDTIAKSLKANKLKFSFLSGPQLTARIAKLVENHVLSFFKQAADILETDIIQSSVIICSVLSLMNTMGIERSRVERDLIYRSNLLSSIYTYLKHTYSKILSDTQGAPPSIIIDMIREDRSIFEIFLLVLNRRLTVIDDLEFQGKQKTTGAAPFLSMDQTAFIADLLNRGVAYRIFENEQIKAYFDGNDSTFLTNLRTCIQRLYDRDKRLNLYPKGFWIVDKALNARIEHANLESAIKNISPSLLTNAP